MCKLPFKDGQYLQMKSLLEDLDIAISTIYYILKSTFLKKFNYCKFYRLDVFLK